jgi:hypothetical protein
MEAKMRRIECILIAVFLVPFLSAYADTENTEEAETIGPEKQAVASAEAWLSLVDEGEYEKSWEAAADYFKQAITVEQWEQSLRAARAPLGAVVSREVRSASYVTELPGAPDGEYVVIQFATSFEHKKSATETVTPMKEKDGSWKVSGYYIK